MAIAALLALTLDPALRMLFTRMDFVHFRPRWLAWLVNQVTVGRYYPEERHPISRVLFAVYEPVCRVGAAPPEDHDRRRRRCSWRRRSPSTSASAPSSCRRSTRATILYMPTTLPGHLGDRGEPAAPDPGPRSCKSFPEVERVFGKAGPRRDLDRPGAVLDDGDDRRAEAAVRVAREAALVLRLGARVAAAASCSRASGPTASRTRSWSPRWTARSRSPAPRTPGRCRSRTASTC